MIKKILFYWLSSFTLATTGYYLLWLIMPKHYVFGVMYRMFLYHWEYPISYIAIPCFFFGLITPLVAKDFIKKNLLKQVFILVLIIALTIFLSAPFGGIIWHYHDMQAGYFPDNWISKMVYKGSLEGLQIGWFIILISIPYNLLGSIVAYFLIKKGETLFNNQ